MVEKKNACMHTLLNIQLRVTYLKPSDMLSRCPYHVVSAWGPAAGGLAIRADQDGSLFTLNQHKLNMVPGY